VLETMDTKASRTVLKLASVDKDDWLLDVGCGSAPFLSRLEEGTLVGIDVAPEALSIARTRTRAHLVRASGEWLPFRDLAFDRVLCHHVLEHLDNMPRGLQDMRRVLKPSAKLVLAYPNSNYLPFLLGIVRQDPLHRGQISSTARFPGFKALQKHVFLNIPHIGDSLTLSKVPLLRDLFYNVIVLLERDDDG